MAAKRRDEGSRLTPMIRVAPLGELRVYMITEEELNSLGRGSPGSVFLNFALALLPLAASFLVTLLSTSIPSVTGLTFFICGCIVCFITGLICLVFAWQNHVSSKAIVIEIKHRMPPIAPIGQAASDTATATDTPLVTRTPELPPEQPK